MKLAWSWGSARRPKILPAKMRALSGREISFVSVRRRGTILSPIWTMISSVLRLSFGRKWTLARRISFMVVESAIFPRASSRREAEGVIARRFEFFDEARRVAGKPFVGEPATQRAAARFTRIDSWARKGSALSAASSNCLPPGYRAPC